MTLTARPDRHWLAGSYWYCPAPDMPALQTRSTDVFLWAIDQTVWQVGGYRDGYFWGAASTVLTPAGATPDPSQRSLATFFASITPEGDVHVTFVRSAASTTLGIGRLQGEGANARFVMQMSSGPGTALVVHWAQMRPIAPGDAAWDDLPGAGISVPAMLEGAAMPTRAQDGGLATRLQLGEEARVVADFRKANAAVLLLR